MYIPPMTKSLAMRVEFSDIQYFIARVKALQNLPNNPYGAEIRQFGSAVAILVRETKHPLFNRVMGVGDDVLLRLDEIVHWYRTQHRGCRFDIVPSNASEVLFTALTKYGLYQSSFYGAMYAGIEFNSLQVPETEIMVDRILPGDRELMAEIYAAGFNLPARIQPVMKDSFKGLYDLPNVRFYGANLKGRLVGVGVLFLSDSIGYLASTSILPEYRSRGSHKALIYHRLADAALEQCNLVVAHCAFASISQRNLEWAGLRLAYTKAIWTAR